MIFIVYTLLTACLASFFIVRSRKQVDQLNKSLRNYKKWLQNSECNVMHKEMAIDDLYAKVEQLESHLAAVEYPQLIVDGIDVQDPPVTELSTLSWTPQHAADYTPDVIYTDSNSSAAYGDEDTSDDI